MVRLGLITVSIVFWSIYKQLVQKRYGVRVDASWQRVFHDAVRYGRLSIVSNCPLEALAVVLDLVASVPLHLEAFSAEAEVA